MYHPVFSILHTRKKHSIDTALYTLPKTLNYITRLNLINYNKEDALSYGYHKIYLNKNNTNHNLYYFSTANVICTI